MIPCTVPHFVGEADYLAWPVAAWDDDGHPMIVGEEGLTRADKMFGDAFEIASAAEADPQGIVQLIPLQEPDVSMVAWALCRDGKVRGVFYDPAVGVAIAADGPRSRAE